MAAPHQAQRTLVKSRPELWAEVSDVESLCKHLGEFGEITITRLEPETTVAWEGTAARGTVELESSGWGTRVTLTAELVDAPEPQADVQPAADPEASGGAPASASADDDSPADASSVVEPVAEVVVPAAEPAAAAEPVAAAEPAVPERPHLPAEPFPRVVEPDPEPAPTPAAIRAAERAATRTAAPASTSQKKPGFFARLFGRRSAPAPQTAPPAPPASDVPSAPAPADASTPVVHAPAAAPMTPAAIPPAPVAAVDEPETPAPPAPSPLRLVPRPDEDEDEDETPTPATTPDDDPPLVAEAAEVVPSIDPARAMEVLTATLDDLGAAHRRPFSNGV